MTTINYHKIDVCSFYTNKISYKVFSFKLLSIPAKILPSHEVKLFVKWLVEVLQLTHHIGVDVWVGASFGFAQAVGLAVACWLFQAWEALGWVEVEVFLSDQPPQMQKVLHTCHLTSWVSD